MSTKNKYGKIQKQTNATQSNQSKGMLCTECLFNFKVEADAVAKLQAENKGTDDIFDISHLSI